MRRFAVAALFPPANVERRAADLQDRLFGLRDLASAQALPPFAALAMLPPGTAPAAFADALTDLRTGFRVEVADAIAIGATLLLDLRIGAEGLECLRRIGEACEGLARVPFSRDAGSVPPAPFPLGPRLWLAEGSSPAEAEAAALWLRRAHDAAAGAAPDAGGARHAAGGARGAAGAPGARGAPTAFTGTPGVAGAPDVSAETPDAASGSSAAGAPTAFATFEYGVLEIEAADGEPWWRELRWRAYGRLRTRRGGRGREQ